ncbi:hypothetical protein [Aestuariivirga litoralis]|uniref:hypothetical protein n=1 Tax=Aestuariivirga litoralis TaxID=2650924 RepID=UPI0018C4983D|nr:hypothetical protein [Aestuariivirga litoralis]MBG1231553.1 hypothetical protein [Aestuariivirga litoralis]
MFRHSRQFMLIASLLALPGVLASTSFASGGGHGDGGGGPGGGGGYHNNGGGGWSGNSGDGHDDGGHHPGDGGGDHHGPPVDHNADGDNGTGDNSPDPTNATRAPATQPGTDPFTSSAPQPDGAPSLYGASAPAAADGNSDGNSDPLKQRAAARFVQTPVLDQEQSKQVIQQGQAASMPLLFAYMNQKFPGQVLDVKLHATGEGLVYEVRYLANIIELRTLFLDAMTLSRK